MDTVSLILCDELRDPKNADQVADLLKVSRAQINTWLKELLKRGVIEKLSKPVRYQVSNEKDRLL